MGVARPRPGPRLELGGHVARAGRAPVEVGLVGVEAEEAAPRAGERHHEGLGAKPQPARLAGRGLPAGREALPVVQHVQPPRRQGCNRRFSAALVSRLCERHAEGHHRFAKALLDVHVAPGVVPERRIGDGPDVGRRHFLDHPSPHSCLQPRTLPQLAKSRPSQRGTTHANLKLHGYDAYRFKWSSDLHCIVPVSQRQRSSRTDEQTSVTVRGS